MAGDTQAKVGSTWQRFAALAGGGDWGGRKGDREGGKEGCTSGEGMRGKGSTEQRGSEYGDFRDVGIY